MKLLRIERLCPVDEHDRDALVIDGILELARLANQVSPGVIRNHFALAPGTGKNLQELRLDHE
jgi:hypothetical protein